eukprot:NODE_41_length_34096_cov_2.002235.p4 type:complete len:658 gc:universal NODE_41_length_34096_cov_2.002235:815-2788(+)
MIYGILILCFEIAVFINIKKRRYHVRYNMISFATLVLIALLLYSSIMFKCVDSLLVSLASVVQLSLVLERPIYHLTWTIPLFWIQLLLFALYNLILFKNTFYFILFIITLSINLHMIYCFYIEAHPNDQDTDNPLIPTTNELPTTSISIFEELKQVFSFVWPSNNMFLQLLFVTSLCCLLLGRYINYLVPILYKYFVDHLMSQKWFHLAIFVFLRALSGGILENFQGLSWTPVEQNTTKYISVKLFTHLHDMNHDFHLKRKTGEILRVQDRGVRSINSIVDLLMFKIVPTIADIAVAALYLTLILNWIFGFIVIVTMTLYILVTIFLTKIRTGIRRRANQLDNIMQSRAVDSLLNFETVKYYSAEEFEKNTYVYLLKLFQKSEWSASIAMSALTFFQSTIIHFGLFVGGLYALAGYKNNDYSIGDIILFFTYMVQLIGPLNGFGKYYKTVQKNFVDIENLLDLLNVDCSISKNCEKSDLIVNRGLIEFKNVTFGYGNGYVFQNLSFKCAPGQTTAFVGSSGCGKSTILKLLFRFYDILDGDILIDNQSIQDVNLKSLRQSLGIVPQDIVLFNEDILYNIKYGKPAASDQEVETAAKASQIHEKIASLPMLYKARVGERGLQLSGGERQRIGICRAFVKNPKILMFDEGTSSLDTTTY